MENLLPDVLTIGLNLKRLENVYSKFSKLIHKQINPQYIHVLDTRMIIHILWGPDVLTIGL
jgi:hypothetical protein